MVQNVTREEVKQTMFSMKDGKAPGPDGYPAGFFKKAWHIVGNEVTDAVLSFFSSGTLLKEMNSTIIALVPKVPNPINLSDYRPISCCSTIYKCISKIIANRIKVVLPELIDRSQSAFIKNINISDNILLS